MKLIEKFHAEKVNAFNRYPTLEQYYHWLSDYDYSKVTLRNLLQFVRYQQRTHERVIQHALRKLHKLEKDYGETFQDYELVITLDWCISETVNHDGFYMMPLRAKYFDD